MAGTTNFNTNTKEDVRMAKYLVEAPVPKEGQKVSSGGIRENGKIASQFKNPVPYKEPTLPPAVVIQKSSAEQLMTRTRRDEVGRYLFSIVCQEILAPLCRSGLRTLCNYIIEKLEARSNPPTRNITSPEPIVVDVEMDEFVTEDDNDKIIRFPKRIAN